MSPQNKPVIDQGAQIFQTLRTKILTLNPQDVNILPTEMHPNLWGVIMESAYPEAVVTLAALVDGTTSLYFSNGGGIIGSGSHPAVGGAAKQMIAVAETCLEYTPPVTECRLPQPEYIHFHLLTFHGPHSLEINERELQTGEHGLSPLYIAGQELIHQIRQVRENHQEG
ncbi:MAG: hypothetical protein JW704_08110 [Anaerolineaceae bacterium]|nr:hypothetical protein [Anaerolineaceae bacterium]